MTQITSFPIFDTDRTADENVSGLSPALCGDVGSPGTSANVSSEYGVRKAIDTYCDTAVSGVNLGEGKGFYKNYYFDDSGNVNLKSLTRNSRRFAINNDGNGNLTVNYNGFSANYPTVSCQYVQGGSEQIFQLIKPDTFSYFVTGGTTGYISGYSSAVIPICANMFQYLSGDSSLSGIALTNFNTDIAIAKIAICYPDTLAFPVSGQKISIGFNGDSEKLGYFYTKTESQMSGEIWFPIEYSESMYKDQYEYYISPQEITLYTDGVDLQQGTDDLSGDFSGEFILRVFYDKVKYQSSNSVYIMGGGYWDLDSQSENIERYLLENNVFSSKYCASLTESVYDYACSNINNYIYIFGGNIGNNINTVSIYRYNIFSDTVSPAYRNSLTEAKTTNKNAGKTTTSLVYLPGGYVYTSSLKNSTNSVNIVNLANDTDDVSSLTLTNVRQDGGFTSSLDIMYYYGGQVYSDGAYSSEYTNSEKIIISTNTISIPVLTLPGATTFINTFSFTDTGWLVGGVKNSTALHYNTIVKHIQSTNTLSISSQSLIYSPVNGVRYSNDSEIGLIGGKQVYGGNNEYLNIQKINISTETAGVMSQNATSSKIYQDSNSI